MLQKIKERETIEAELGEFLEEIESNYSNAIIQVILFGSKLKVRKGAQK